MMRKKQQQPLILPENQDHYSMMMRGGTANFMLMILLSSITIIIPLLLSRQNAIFYSSTPFYITVVVLFVCVMYLKLWGIFVAAITLLASGLLLDLPSNVYFVNTAVNILQLGLLLATYSYLTTHKKASEQSLYYEKGYFYLSLYNVVILFLFLGYCILCMLLTENVTPFMIAISATLFVATVAKATMNRDMVLLKYTAFVALLPSLICSVLSAYFCNVPSDVFFQYCMVWTLSNYIFLQTIGYVLFQVFYSRAIHPFKWQEIIDVNLSSALYYVAVVILNLLIIYLHVKKIIGPYGFIYFFPWLLGNAFLLFNLYFTRFDNAEGLNPDERFAWYEKRIITVEKNTSGIITIISFMLPLSVTLLKDNIPAILIVIFAANIFFACLSVGLIWIPNRRIKFIGLLKSIKTISYTYSITLLLISSIMIMFLSLSQN